MAGIRRFLEAVMKKEGDEEHSADHYLVVEDPEKTTTWHLRVKGPDGKLDHRLMGAAWAALHGGYRGNKYEGPDKQKALAKLKAIYKGEDMPEPGGGESEISDRRILEVEISPVKADASFEGREGEITIIGAKEAEDLVTIDGVEYVKSKNGRLYSVEALKESVPLWEGVKIYDNHLTDEEFQERQGMRSVSAEWMGAIVSPKGGGKKKQSRGIFKVVEEGVGKKLKNAWDQGVLGTIGLSIDTSPIERVAVHEGRQVPVVTGFNRIFSVDVVAEPAAGGGFQRLICAT